MVTAFVNEIETNLQKLLWVRETAKRLSNRRKATETEGLVYIYNIQINCVLIV